jgi:hypothetical protein
MLARRPGRLCHRHRDRLRDRRTGNDDDDQLHEQPGRCRWRGSIRGGHHDHDDQLDDVDHHDHDDQHDHHHDDPDRDGWTDVRERARCDQWKLPLHAIGHLRRRSVEWRELRHVAD